MWRFNILVLIILTFPSSFLASEQKKKDGVKRYDYNILIFEKNYGDRIYGLGVGTNDAVLTMIFENDTIVRKSRNDGAIIIKNVPAGKPYVRIVEKEGFVTQRDTLFFPPDFIYHSVILKKIGDTE